MWTKNKYPIYIISKGRWQTRRTAKILNRMGAPYCIVIEPQEYSEYAKVIDPEKILTLPFSNLGLGSIPARNWVWEHSITLGAERHWILDDNIRMFFRVNHNTAVHVLTSAVFNAMEDFVDRYENIAIAGPQYANFAYPKTRRPPYILNTRIYSCLLIRNDLPYRWRGKYNEDTDLCLRVLKDKWCTLLFSAFLIEKKATMLMKGGNTDSIYNTGDNRLAFAQSLAEQHPDVVKVIWKYNRWHHKVDYTPFKHNKLILKPDAIIPEGINNFGMVLRNVTYTPKQEK